MHQIFNHIHVVHVKVEGPEGSIRHYIRLYPDPTIYTYTLSNKWLVIAISNKDQLSITVSLSHHRLVVVITSPTTPNWSWYKELIEPIQQHMAKSLGPREVSTVSWDQWVSDVAFLPFSGRPNHPFTDGIFPWLSHPASHGIDDSTQIRLECPTQILSTRFTNITSSHTIFVVSV